LLEVPKREYFAIDGIHLLEPSLYLCKRFFASGDRARRRIASRDLNGDPLRRRSEVVASSQRKLTADASDFGTQMLTVELDHALRRQEPNPEKERNLGFFEIVVETSRRLEERVLDHI